MDIIKEMLHNLKTLCDNLKLAIEDENAKDANHIVNIMNKSTQIMARLSQIEKKYEKYGDKINISEKDLDIIKDFIKNKLTSDE